MTVRVRLDKRFEKSYQHISNAKERDKVDDALAAFESQGSSAAHFKYLTEIPKTVKAKGLVLARLCPLAAAKAHGAFRILLREDVKNGRYTVLDIQAHENCYRDWQRKYKTFL